MSIILICLLAIIFLFLLRKYLKGGQCKNKHSMKGKVVIVTGASPGIGKESAIDLAKHGAKVILACRNEEKTKEAMKSLNEEERKLVKFIYIDLSDFNSIIQFSKKVRNEYNKIDILMNNAGLFPQEYVVTKDKMEYFLQGNFVGHVLLTFLLFDMLDQDDARIINLSSLAHINSDFTDDLSSLAHINSDFTDDINIQEMFDLKKAESKYYKSIAGKGKLYGNTKLLMIYFSKFLTKLFEGKCDYIKSAAVHPGGVDTEFMRFVTLKKNIVIKILFLANYSIN